ncbi:hypothetical protein Pelo_1841 [Pelomyxa schiedti]|nr:hypothetical protein Pelo_1841 [Pelomyxa schiedti]
MTTTNESMYMEELMEKVGEGDSNAMYDLARSYLPTEFDVKDPGSYTKGLSLLQQAVNGNNAEAMFKLAEAYLAPRYGLTQDISKGMSLLQQAVARGSDDARYFRDLFIKVGAGPAEGVLLLLERAIARNNTEAMLILAEGYLEPKDVSVAPGRGTWKYLRVASWISLGKLILVNSPSDFIAPLSRIHGFGSLQNYPKGISLLQRAVDGHNTNAMVESSCTASNLSKKILVPPDDMNTGSYILAWCPDLSGCTSIMR